MIRRPPRSTLFPLHDALPICLMPAQPSGTVLTSTASAGRFSALNSGAVRRLTAVDLTQRYMVAQEFLERKIQDRKSTRLNSSHLVISYAVFFLKKQHDVYRGS